MGLNILILGNINFSNIFFKSYIGFMSGKKVQNYLLHYFNWPYGSVHWQDHMVDKALGRINFIWWNLINYFTCTAIAMIYKNQNSSIEILINIYYYIEHTCTEIKITSHNVFKADRDIIYMYMYLTTLELI